MQLQPSLAQSQLVSPVVVAHVQVPFSSHLSWWDLGSRVPSSSRTLAEEQPCVLLGVAGASPESLSKKKKREAIRKINLALISEESCKEPSQVIS